jgi:hypothetical protein
VLVYTTDRGVWALAPGEPPKLVVRTTGEILDVERSDNGYDVGVLSAAGGITSFTLHDLSGGETLTWPLPGVTATEVGFVWSTFVVVDEDPGTEYLTFTTSALDSATPPPAKRINGVSGARLLAAQEGTLLVATSERATARGGPETVHQVYSNGDTTRLFTDGQTGLTKARRNLPIGVAGLTADGQRLVYGTGYAGGECAYDFDVAVFDIKNRTEIPPAKAPSLGQGSFSVVASVSLDGGGRTVVGLSDEVGGCGGTGRASAYLYYGEDFRPFAGGAVWAGASADGRLATLDSNGALTVDEARVATGVARAMW